MKTQHTSGPWELAELPHAIVVRTQSRKKSKYGADRYAAIGGFDRGNPEQLAEALANARLIAAAPDLLAALKDLAQAIVWKEFGECRGFTEEMPLPIITAVENARASIAKATGEQQ